MSASYHLPTQDAIAKKLGISPATVHRILQRKDRVEADLANPSPKEVIARHWDGTISHKRMMDDLLSRDYTAGYIVEGTYDTRVRGTWDDITEAYINEMISDKDLDRLSERAP